MPDHDRLLALEDRLAILDLEGAYARAFDSHDGAAWAALFTVDGVYQARGLAPGDAGHHRGRAALAEFCTHAPFDGLHLMHVPEVTVDGDLGHVHEVESVERGVGAELGQGRPAAVVAGVAGCEAPGLVHAVDGEERRPGRAVVAVEGAGVGTFQVEDRQAVLQGEESVVVGHGCLRSRMGANAPGNLADHPHPGPVGCGRRSWCGGPTVGAWPPPPPIPRTHPHRPPLPGFPTASTWSSSARGCRGSGRPGTCVTPSGI
ncbi:MAG: nuclear transport factor 2 family protein [Actinomycetes bacterium]